MTFYALLEAVFAYDRDEFVKRYPHPVLLENDPADRRTTRRIKMVRDPNATKIPDDDDDAPTTERRFFEVVRKQGGEGYVLIGRSPEADICIPDEALSPRHATLWKGPDGWLLTDLGSKGTTLGGVLVEPNVPTEIARGVAIGFGPFLRFALFEPDRLHEVLKRLGPQHLAGLRGGGVVDSDTTSLDTAPPPLAPAEAAALGAGLTDPDLERRDLVVRCHPFNPVVLPHATDVTVGRTTENEIVLPHSSVSRHHAIFRRTGVTVLVKDLKSSNGIFIGARRVEGEAVCLPGGPPVKIGPYELAIEAVVDAEELQVAEDPLSSTSVIDSSSLKSSLEAMPLREFLQGVELHRRTGSVRVESPDGTVGAVHFVEGSPHSAEFGALRGVDAIHAMLRVSSGTFGYTPKSKLDGPTTIRGTFTAILLEVVRLADEAERGSPYPAPRPSRMRLQPPSTEDAKRLTTAIQAAEAVIKEAYAKLHSSPVTTLEQFIVSVERGTLAPADDPAALALKSDLAMLMRKGERGAEGKTVLRLLVASHGMKTSGLTLGAKDLCRSLRIALGSAERPLDVPRIIDALLGCALKFRTSADDLTDLAEQLVAEVSSRSR